MFQKTLILLFDGAVSTLFTFFSLKADLNFGFQYSAILPSDSMYTSNDILLPLTLGFILLFIPFT
ncbi:hypothetical protein CN601_02795 [Bacillus sp. AFS017336]|nr:hypothetical protein CN601_02795 [Bacillus sp. AFS017336]